MIKGAGDGEVILDGGGNFNLFNVKTGDYNYIEGITFRNTDIAIWAGTQFQQGSKGLTVKNCRFENVDVGIFSNYSGSSDFYIADNTFIGRDNLNYLTAWANSPYGTQPAPGRESYWAQFNGVGGQVFPPTMASYVAVKVYGPGHVIAYNYVEGFHDGIDTETYGNPDGSDATKGPHYPPREYWERRTVAVDYYNNYMTNFHDNSFEIDGSEHNIRVMRNMMINSANEPMCNQPAVGGPIYWIRNIIYHAPDGALRMTSGAPGVLFYNNTILTEVSVGSSANNHWRNNLILGEGTSPAIFRELTYTNYSDSDYNGFRVNPGADYSFQWTSPPWNIQADYSALVNGTGGAVRRVAVADAGADRQVDLRANLTPHLKLGASRLSRNIRRPRIRINIASPSITMFLSMFRGWKKLLRLFRSYTKHRISISVSSKARLQLIRVSSCRTLPTASAVAPRISALLNMVRLRRTMARVIMLLRVISRRRIELRALDHYQL